ncbi:MAG: hypothetical protein JJT81_06465 [Rubellimicrobium sp.]|nr:hypothetical protein [Rubellimicrobium sp.]
MKPDPERPSLSICLTCRDARPAPLRATILGRLVPLGTVSDLVPELQQVQA